MAHKWPFSNNLGDFNKNVGISLGLSSGRGAQWGVGGVNLTLSKLTSSDDRRSKRGLYPQLQQRLNPDQGPVGEIC